MSHVLNGTVHTVVLFVSYIKNSKQKHYSHNLYLIIHVFRLKRKSINFTFFFSLLSKQEYVFKYQGQGCQLSAQEPHIYAVTEAMYSQLKSANQSQSCVISGESGAGKCSLNSTIINILDF